MSANLKTDSKALQIIAWIASLLACALYIWMYFRTNYAIKTVGEMFAGMGVELPVQTRWVLEAHYLLPVLFIGPAVVVVGKELIMRDKKLSLATTFFAALLVVVALGLINNALYAPLQSLVQQK